MWCLHASFTIYYEKIIGKIKLNVKHRMCCNKIIDYKMLTNFFSDIIAWLIMNGKEVTLIYWGTGCTIFRILGFSWKINFWVCFVALFNFLVRFSWNTKLYFIFEVWKGMGIGTDF